MYHQFTKKIFAIKSPKKNKSGVSKPRMNPMALSTTLIFLLALSVFANFNAVVLAFFEAISAKTLCKKLRHDKAPMNFHCTEVTRVNSSIRKVYTFPNEDINKYVEVYGIPVISTDAVTDQALFRACYVTAFVFAHRADVRNIYYQGKGFIQVLGFAEKPDRPPANCKITGWWRGYDNERGLPVTDKHPYVIGAEENVLCAHKSKLMDPYRKEDMLLHQLAHTVLAILFVTDRQFKTKTIKAFKNAKRNKKWHSVYAGKNIHEYFAEGSQSFFNVNVEGAKRDHVHGKVNTRHELKRYDPHLYDLVSSAFPCTDDFIRKCEVDPHQGAQAVFELEMDCKETSRLKISKCKDHNIWCKKWAEQGECDKNPLYMRTKCRKTCKTCKKQIPGCFDYLDECESWTILGECDKNPGFMHVHCPLSCESCPKKDENKSRNHHHKECKDHLPQCRGWKILGQCEERSSYMNQFCRKTCLSCSS